MKLDSTYFSKYPLKLVQSTGGGNGISKTVKDSDITIITDCIDTFEPQFYTDLLGEDLANELIAAYEASIATPTPIPLPEKWDTLLNKLFNVTKKQSPVANYVYCYILDEIQLHSTRSGVAISKIDEGEILSQIGKQVRAWNLMVGKLYSVYTWLYDNIDLFEHDEVYFNPTMDSYQGIMLLKKKNIYGI